MNRTYTPELDPGTLQRLEEFASLFRDDFNRREQARLVDPYLRGLLMDGERKSVEPMVERLDGWGCLGLSDPVQAVRHFVGHGHWDHEAILKRYREVMISRFGSPKGILVIDDSGNKKQGRHSVGVQRQYCGVLKEVANCQVAVTTHYVAPNGHFPLNGRLFLPESWTSDEGRLDEGKVPLKDRKPLTKTEIALGLVDQVLSEGIPVSLVVFDATYGSAAPFRRGMAARGLPFVAGVKADVGVFTEEPHWDPPERRPRGKRGPGPTVPYLSESCRPTSVAQAAQNLVLKWCVWRQGTKGKLGGFFARMRVWPARRAELSHGLKDLEGPMWLVVEQRGDERRHYLTTLPENTSMKRMVRLIKSRWPVEQGYQQLKEELGFDHFEGRRWAGFHHHMALTFLAFGFLELERQRLREHQNGSEKKVPGRREKSNCESPHQ